MKSLLRTLASGLWRYLAPLAIRLAHEEGKLLVATANEIAELLDDVNLSGEEKRHRAFELVKAHVVSRWQDVPTHLVNASLELAVVNLRVQAEKRLVTEQ